MLNIYFLSKNRVFKTSLLAAVCLLLAVSINCGKRKPPQPPTEKVSQRTAISGVQQGSVVALSWQLPPQNADDRSLLNISRVDVYRLLEAADSPLTLSEEEFASRSVLISSLPVSEKDFSAGKLTFNDYLQFASQNVRLRYAVRFVNSSGQKAAFSNFLLIEPTARVAEIPSDLKANVSETVVELKWKAPTENVDGSSPANILGYNIYRKTDSDESPKILNASPVAESYFNDRSFVFSTNYKYLVRTVSLGGNGEPIESLDSNTISVKPSDIFPPSAPSGITVAAAPGNLALFFAVNPEKDIAGYRVYRSTDPDRVLSQWELLTEELLMTNTFQDTNVQSGTVYFYYITAVDSNGNVSRASVIVSEKAP